MKKKTYKNYDRSAVAAFKSLSGLFRGETTPTSSRKPMTVRLVSSYPAHKRDAHNHDTHSRDAHNHDAHSRDAYNCDIHSRDAHNGGAHNDNAHYRDAHNNDAQFRDKKDAHNSDAYSTVQRSPQLKQTQCPLSQRLLDLMLPLLFHQRPVS